MIFNLSVTVLVTNLNYNPIVIEHFKYMIVKDNYYQ